VFTKLKKKALLSVFNTRSCANTHDKIRQAKRAAALSQTPIDLPLYVNPKLNA
jgi:hypothetical protein